ncbi:MAG: flagellar basal body P-ring formation protein FlgA [Alphaproteobacteria bacterium]|nr:flagellar basal body P-ring formation protein FlgA [Alphaproteobacteria bacterium]
MRSVALYIFFWLMLTASTVQGAPAVIGEQDLLDAVAAEFVEQGMDEAIDIEFFGGRTAFVFEDADNAKIMVSRLKYDELQNKFTADVEIFADGRSRDKTVLQGKYYVLNEVWVPTVNISKGEYLTPDKLKTIAVRANRIKPMHVTDLEKLVNMEAKKSLKEGRLITERDVGAKIIIKKGDIVNSVYRTPHMQITAKAEAQRDAAKGDKLEIMNIKSRKNLFGTVIDKDTVLIEVQ